MNGAFHESTTSSRQRSVRSLLPHRSAVLATCVDPQLPHLALRAAIQTNPSPGRRCESFGLKLHSCAPAIGRVCGQRVRTWATRRVALRGSCVLSRFTISVATPELRNAAKQLHDAVASLVKILLCFIPSATKSQDNAAKRACVRDSGVASVDTREGEELDKPSVNARGTGGPRGSTGTEAALRPAAAAAHPLPT